jgi:alkylated DNA repair dioxygenase AlkB
MQSSLFNTTDNLLPFNGEALLFPALFSKTESDDYLQQLITGINWKQEAIIIFGKEVMQPRLTAWYGDSDKSYSYSGITMHPQSWTSALLEIKKRIEPIANTHFTSALLNYYRDGKDSMGWHRDNEKELGLNPIIGSVSFGAARTFQLRNYADKNIVRSVELTHGSFLLMRGETQHYWEHRVPKAGARNGAMGARINITFRVIL